MSQATVLLVDDDENVLAGLRDALRNEEYRVLTADGPATALHLLHSEPVDVVLSDHCMPGMTGLEFLKRVRDRHPDTVRIMLTGHADARTAVKAINEGEIYRFLEKPCRALELRITLHLALERLELERKNRRLLAIVQTNPDLLRRVEEEETLYRQRCQRRTDAASDRNS